MKRLFVLAAVTALAVARPETYKEQEDFQFSRSSSDDGTKSGYYGAQRGNMGGNYERAHNMDSLAQNQMSGLVRQVEGELGDGANTRTGSVYSAANSRGTYGSGHFDLSNLAGRNFGEGTYYDSSKAHSSQSARSAYNSGHTNSHSQSYDGQRYAGYGAYQRATSDAQVQTDDLQSLDNSHTSNQYDYGRSSSHSSGYQAHSGYQQNTEYDRSNANSNSNSGYGSNIRTRLISTVPVRIILTPGGRVAVPVGAQTYDVRQGSTVLDQNTINSEADVLNQNNEDSNAKRYESSYSYRKKWEKHDTIPTTQVIVSRTETPPINSELYEDSDAYRGSSQNGAQSARTRSASGSSSSSTHQAAYGTNYNTHQRGSVANSNLNTYDQTRYNAGSNHVASSDSSNAYQSQYGAGSRYHDASSAANLNAYTQTAQNGGSHTDSNSQVEDLNARPKSYQSSYSYHKSWERQGDPYIIKPASNGYSDSQSSQRLTSSTKTGAAYHSGSHYGHDQDCDENGHIRVARSYNSGNVEQQPKRRQLDNLEDNEGQQFQKTWENLVDPSQQSQSNWDQQSVGQQSLNKWDNLEEYTQQSQNVGQQSQNTWNSLDDLTQQTQSVGQQSENKWDHFADLTQQTQSVGQQSENKWDNLENLAQQSQSVGQQSKNKWDNLENLDQQSQRSGQQSQNIWDNLEDLPQQTQSVGQQSQNKWDNTEDFAQQTQNLGQRSRSTWDNAEDLAQQLGSTETVAKQSTLEPIADIGQQNQSQNIVGEYSQAFETEIGFDPESVSLQTHQLHDNNKPYFYQESKKDGEEYNKNLWRSFDILDQNNTQVRTQHKPKDELITQLSQIYGFKNNGDRDPKINTSYINTDYDSQYVSTYQKNSDVKPLLDQNFGSLDLDSMNIPSIFYSYSNGFTNPVMSHVPNDNNNFRVSREHFENNSMNLGHTTNSESYLHVNDSQATSQVSSLSKFWDKFDSIEKASGLSDHVQYSRDVKQAESNLTSISPNVPALAHYPSQLQTDKTITYTNKFDSNLNHEHTETNSSTKNEEHRLTPQEELQQLKTLDQSQLRETFKQSPNGTFDTNTKHKRTETNSPLKREENRLRSQEELHQLNTFQQSLNEHQQIQSTSSENQESSQDIGRGDIVPEDLSDQIDEMNESLVKLINPYKSHKSLNETTTANGNLMSVPSLHQQKSQEKGITKHNYTEIHTFNQSQKNTEQKVDNFAGAGQHNSYNIGHRIVQNFGRENKNVEPQSLNNYQQVNDHDFGQQNENLEQQNLHNFDQEQVQDLSQHNENPEQQNLHSFGQENLQSFGHENGNLEQQNLHNFGQENLHDFGQQNENLGQRNLHNATHDKSEEQKDLNLEHNDDHIYNDYVKYIGQKDEHLEPQSINIEEDHNQIYGQQYQRSQKNDNSEDLEQSNKTFLFPVEHGHPNKKEETLVKQEHNLNTAELLQEGSESDKTELPPEPTTEKPGFWKSVGSKFSNAKDKLVTWFKS